MPAPRMRERWMTGSRKLPADNEVITSDSGHRSCARRVSTATPPLAGANGRTSISEEVQWWRSATPTACSAAEMIRRGPGRARTAAPAMISVRWAINSRVKGGTGGHPAALELPPVVRPARRQRRRSRDQRDSGEERVSEQRSGQNFTAVAGNRPPATLMTITRGGGCRRGR